MTKKLTEAEKQARAKAREQAKATAQKAKEKAEADAQKAKAKAKAKEKAAKERAKAKERAAALKAKAKERAAQDKAKAKAKAAAKKAKAKEQNDKKVVAVTVKYGLITQRLSFMGKTKEEKAKRFKQMEKEYRDIEDKLLRLSDAKEVATIELNTAKQRYNRAIEKKEGEEVLARLKAAVEKKTAAQETAKAEHRSQLERLYKKEKDLYRFSAAKGVEVRSKTTTVTREYYTTIFKQRPINVNTICPRGETLAVNVRYVSKYFSESHGEWFEDKDEWLTVISDGTSTVQELTEALLNTRHGRSVVNKVMVEGEDYHIIEADLKTEETFDTPEGAYKQPLSPRQKRLAKERLAKERKKTKTSQ